MERRPRLNNQIRVPEVNAIGPEGEKLGVIPLHEALRIAGQRNFDVVEVGPTAKPPVVRIMDFGKYQYQQERSQKKGGGKAPGQEIKTVQITFKAGEHDLGIKAAQADKFLEKGHRVNVAMKLRGREKGMVPMGRTKLEHFLTLITSPYELEGQVKGFLGGIGGLIKPRK